MQDFTGPIKPHSDILASLLKEIEPIDFHLNTSSPGKTLLFFDLSDEAAKSKIAVPLLRV